MLDLSCFFFLVVCFGLVFLVFFWKCSFSIPSHFSIGGDILAAPYPPVLVECSTIQVIPLFTLLC